MPKAGEWNAERLCYEGIGRALTGRKTPVREIPAGENELGYTASDGVIHLAGNHALMSGLTEEEKRFFRMGVFAHELLHQLLTDFRYLEQVLGRYPPGAERSVVALFANLVEDPAIEYEGDTQIGGALYEALRFTILHIYENSGLIQDAGTPFTQLTTALVQFGDMGLLKGRFTSDRAREAFRAIAPEFNSAIESGDPRMRTDMAVRWAGMTRDMWDAGTEEGKRGLLAGLKRFAEDNGITETNGNGGPHPLPEGRIREDRPSAKRRRDLAKQIETARGLPENEADAQPGKDGKTEPGGADAGCAPGGEAPDTVGAGRDAGTPDPWEDAPGSRTQAVMRREEKEIRRGEILDFSRSVTDAAERAEARKNRESTDFREKTGLYRAVQCLDTHAEIRPQERDARVREYSRIMELHGRDIRLLTASLAKLFTEDAGEIRRALRGKYNITRAAKQSTAKIFDRRVEPKRIESLAVMMLIDESGSMHGRKAQMAREAAVVLAECFARLKIPCYIMGFTTGTEHDAVHTHYVTWNNTPEERLTLTGIDAHKNNFDAYAIRAGADILRKKHAEHKIMIVVSDGYPACDYYRSTEAAVADTAAAVREAETCSVVLAIGIGNCSPQVLRRIYKGCFVHAGNPEDLSEVLTKRLRNVIRNF